MATLKNTRINDTGAVTLPSGGTGTRPASPTNGMTRYNTDTNLIETYDGSAWNSLVNIERIEIKDQIRDGLTPQTAGLSAKQIKDDTGTTMNGWYWLKPPGISTAQRYYCNMNYDGGGWVLVMQNRGGNGGMAGLGYNTAKRDFMNTRSFSYSASPRINDFNCWVGLDLWRKLTYYTDLPNFVCYVAGSVRELDDTGNHSRRSRWNFTGFGGTGAWSGTANLTNELGGTTPGLWSYHIGNGYNLTTTDSDNDAYGSNCSNLYAGNPWWYGACWDGNFFGGGSGYVDNPYWTGSGSDYYAFMGSYIK